MCHYPQDRLLPLLSEVAFKASMKLEKSEAILFGQEVIDFRADEEGVDVTVLPIDQSSPYIIRSNYLIGADGANSFVRKKLGIEMEGTDEIQNLVNVHFRSKSLGTTMLRNGRPGMLYFVFNTQVIAVIVAHDLESGDFVAQVMTWSLRLLYEMTIIINVCCRHAFRFRIFLRTKSFPNSIIW